MEGVPAAREEELDSTPLGAGLPIPIGPGLPEETGCRDHPRQSVQFRRRYAWPSVFAGASLEVLDGGSLAAGFEGGAGGGALSAGAAGGVAVALGRG